MPEQSTIHNTFVIERSYPKPPATVFAAFADPAKKRRWFAEGHSHDVEEFTMDFRVGGSERSAYRLKEGTPFPGVRWSAKVTTSTSCPISELSTAADMSFGGRRISTRMVTIEFLPTENGTDLICTHQGAFFEGADGPKMREGGWRKLFDQLEAELAR